MKKLLKKFLITIIVSNILIFGFIGLYFGSFYICKEIFGWNNSASNMFAAIQNIVWFVVGSMYISGHADAKGW